MKRKANELCVGDVFRMHVYGEVVKVGHVAAGKRIKVKLTLEDQGRRCNSGFAGSCDRDHPLEFTDTGCTLEFLCRPGRVFHLVEWWDDDDDDDDVVEPNPVPSPEMAK